MAFISPDCATNRQRHPFFALLHSQYGHKMGPDELEGNDSGDHRPLAKWLDRNDPLASLRGEFHIPRMATLPGVDFSLVAPAEECVYLCGNSVGLQPKGAAGHIQNELRQWAEMGVHAHFAGPEPWTRCDDRLLGEVAKLVGANSAEEVALMNCTTVNIHILFAAFFRPTPARYKVLLEAGAFPSDHYAVESQLRLNGLDPAQAMICMRPAQGEECLRTEDILDLLDLEGPSIAIVFFSGIQYYTGQFFDIERITKWAQGKGCLVGWDLAHAVANVPLRLHDWNVDFACWCNYKYASAGPGGVAGIFVHERYAKCGPLGEDRRLLGWWAHRLESRFRMTNRMELAEGAAGFRLGTPSPLLMAGMRASLELLGKTSMAALRQKSLLLTGYLEFLLDKRLGEKETGEAGCAVITPRDPAQRGCQLSLKFAGDDIVGPIYAELVKRGIVLDKRCPDVLRVAPVHLYNTFEDCWRFVQALLEAIEVVGELKKHTLAKSNTYNPNLG